jgi:hypothetical protein
MTTALYRLYISTFSGISAKDQSIAAKTLRDIGCVNVTRNPDSCKDWPEARYPIYSRHKSFVLLPNGLKKRSWGQEEDRTFV